MQYIGKFQEAVGDYVREVTGADQVNVTNAKLLSGGAVQENWALDIVISKKGEESKLECVLRCNSPTSGVSISHGREHEFILLSRVFQAGVTVPEPLWLCSDSAVIGSPFFMMRRVGGTGAGHAVAKDDSLGGDRQKLTETLGMELARIHSITPPDADLDFLPELKTQPALHRIHQHRTFLDGHHTPYTVLEWGLRWLERNAPLDETVTLCHGDYRTGNYMVDKKGLTGILDWEFAGWSDPHEDIGWFCAKCWRFGNNEKEAGGIGFREDFYRGYERESGIKINDTAVRYWEVMAHVTWAIIAIQQAERHCSGEEPSLLLALTGHIVPELEWEILNLTESE